MRIDSRPSVGSNLPDTSHRAYRLDVDTRYGVTLNGAFAMKSTGGHGDATVRFDHHAGSLTINEGPMVHSARPLQTPELERLAQVVTLHLSEEAGERKGLLNKLADAIQREIITSKPAGDKGQGMADVSDLYPRHDYRLSADSFSVKLQGPFALNEYGNRVVNGDAKVEYHPDAGSLTINEGERVGMQRGLNAPELEKLGTVVQSRIGEESGATRSVLRMMLSSIRDRTSGIPTGDVVDTLPPRAPDALPTRAQVLAYEHLLSRELPHAPEVATPNVQDAPHWTLSNAHSQDGTITAQAYVVGRKLYVHERGDGSATMGLDRWRAVDIPRDFMLPGVTDPIRFSGAPTLHARAFEDFLGRSLDKMERTPVAPEELAFLKPAFVLKNSIPDGEVRVFLLPNQAILQLESVATREYAKVPYADIMA